MIKISAFSTFLSSKLGIVSFVYAMNNFIVYIRNLYN